MYGINETHSSGHGVRRDNYEYAYARGFQAEVSPEDLFNMFFGGGFAQQNVYMRQQRRRQQHRDEGEVSVNFDLEHYTLFIFLCTVIRINQTHRRL